MPILPCVVVIALLATASPTTPLDDKQALTNTDVLTLVGAGVPESVILARIGSADTDFDLSVDDLVALSEAGVTETILEAMIRTAAVQSEGLTPGDGGGRVGSNLRVGDTFSDLLVSGGSGPEMVVVPAGSFLMGCSSGVDCPELQVGSGMVVRKSKWRRQYQPREVSIRESFAVSKYEVTRAQAHHFVNNVLGLERSEWNKCVGRQWCVQPHERQVDYDSLVAAEDDQRPVEGSWQFARDYVSWLSSETGAVYRLLSEAEWEWMARAGSATMYHFGDDKTRLCDFGNLDASAGGVPCEDGFAGAAPAGSFRPNAWGLHDTIGNAWEWVEDCFLRDIADRPGDGSAYVGERMGAGRRFLLGGDCARVLRGGGWGDHFRRSNIPGVTSSYPTTVGRSAYRTSRPKDFAEGPGVYIYGGIRLARELGR